ncbi:MAG: ABC-F family ATP-binding cassette domain-containing protein [Epsilonproteobacteria bacterium]|nr:ABC-F family ATP-binding cassette domain-containing protein [Campylobacterota bacterium]OIO16285.1 MAG: ABC transporter ATP-binding protein [Helicobacteraceae bacterium CG1_02_36_14]PIP09542.1 MAG: ABC transporter ATP-binding protein [Sulfurimonas sp. CG23_combo_of_CG06-09_8_20_14_all_36_33]PIS24887.1 MAG: ABC transporter ATP-binding protein [Sulfurimonas sp. CG08_land_8_20_14_0_20_36_33]PIU33612.1 MAG: ABC transporter ATP-binding protein [Sulfurimonas sp. CG07_land_8_20_14_0_80_36_56]PIV05
MIQLLNISKSFSSQELFSNLNFKLNSGNRIGLVGRNGSGKSTLFKIILGEESPDSGDVIIPKGYKIGTLKQHLTFSESTLREEAALALEEEMKYDVYRVEKILFGLGFTLEDLEKDPLSFSGGYQIRINLAKLLVTQPNLLLLDEPTNYLDIVSLRWLKSFLRAFEGEVILITHNRDFMDSIVTHTMGIVRKSLFLVPGDTHKFYEQLQANEELHAKQKISQDKKVKELEDFIARNKARASTASLAQSKVKQLEKMDILDDLGFDNTLKFDFNFKETPAKVLLDVKDLSFGYTPENILFEKISFTLEKGECLGIIGKNGKGKSTLLNTIAGELKHLSGEVNFHSSTSFAHFGQTNIAHLNPNSTVMDEIYVGNSQLSESNVRSICGGMMFSGESAKKKISLLSGGEKSRVMLGQILARHVNLLFLDEPTNHLDIDSIEALTKAIENFKGSVIIVTHSEEMLRRVCDRLIIFAKDGAEYFDGGYDLFLEKIGWEEDESVEKVKQAPKANNKENKKLKAGLVRERNNVTAPLKKKVQKLESEIIKLEESLEAHHKELVEVSNCGESAALIELSKLVSSQEAKVEELFETLEHAQSELDDINEEYEKKSLALEG